MANITFHMSRSAEGAAITAFIPGLPPKVASSDHPNFRAIREALSADDFVEEEILGLFEGKAPIKTLERRFQRLTDRVMVREGKLYFDGDEVDNLAARAITQLMSEGKVFMPVVRFLEKLFDNPNEHSRQQAYRWLTSQALTITEDGDVVGYKGCKRLGNGVLASTTAGTAIIDGVEHRGYIPYPLGAIAEMPRSAVVHDPSSACSTGLHVGTHSYAKTFGTQVVEVHVNPRDIVSVPSGEDQKMRVCRLKVVKEINAAYQTAIRTTHAPTPPIGDPADDFVKHLPVIPAADTEFADCVMCETCGECKTHDECICAEAERQRSELEITVAEQREQSQALIRQALVGQGIDWEPEWTEGPAPVAKLGQWEVGVDVDDEQRGLAEGEQGELTAEVVGHDHYNNLQVKFYFTPVGAEDSIEVEPIDELEPLGLPTPEEEVASTPTAPFHEFGPYPTDESGLEPEDEDDEDEDDEDEDDAAAHVPDGLERWAIDNPDLDEDNEHPTQAEFDELKARAKRRRQNFVKYAQQVAKWTFLGGDGNDRTQWEVPAPEGDEA